MSTSAVMLRSTRLVRHSRVCSSMIETSLMGRPSVVASNWKSTAHTLFGASAFGGGGVVEAPRRLRRRRCGTRRPSSRQSRWIFLWFTAQPSPRASACALRNPRRGCAFAQARSHARSAASGSAGVVAARFSALRGALLTGHPAGEPLGQTHRGHQVVHGGPASLRAQKFPRAISFNAAFSNSASASSRLSVEFSRSRSFSRFASSAFSPPNWLRQR